MATALNVAKYILSIPEDGDGELISNLKLQKLLYYCQGFSLAIRDKPLFSATIKAWIHGPVVPEVWHAFREYGSAQIPAPTDFEPKTLSEDERGLIDEVYSAYGQFSGWKLRQMSHREPPWAETEKDAVIPHSRLLAYFKTQITDDAEEDQKSAE